MQNLKRITSYLLVFGLILSLASCTESSVESETYSRQFENYINTENSWYADPFAIEGNALGTYIIIKTSDDTLLISPQEIDAFMQAFNQELSTYIPTSLVSQFNNNEITELNLNETTYFKTCFEKSLTLAEQSNGAFDPTVFHLIQLWDKIKKEQILPTEEEINNVLEFTGFKEGKTFTYTDGVLTKKDERLQLVFNAIAKGQAVDELAEILEAKGQENFYVEIGGELRVKGINDNKTKWIIGIDEPITSNTGLDKNQERPIENYIEITNKGMATSGNYRNFYELNGEVYGHTIDPNIGRPVLNRILSATVIADDVATADAFATAFMVMDVEKAIELLNSHPEYNISAYFLYLNEKGGVSRLYDRGMLMYLMDK